MKLSKAQKITLAFYKKSIPVSFILCFLASALTTSLVDAFFVFVSAFGISLIALALPFLIATCIASLFANIH